MAEWRRIYNSICSSDSLEDLSDFEENLFFKLLVCVDDYGRMDARPLMVKAMCYPLRESATADKIQKALRTLEAHGIIKIYGKKPVLEIVNFAGYQKIKAPFASKYPGAPEGSMSKDETSTSEDESSTSEDESSTSEDETATANYETATTDYEPSTTKNETSTSEDESSTSSTIDSRHKTLDTRLKTKTLDIDKEGEGGSDSGESDCPTVPVRRSDVDHAVERWNLLGDCGIKPVSLISPGSQRDTMLRARIRQYGIDEVLAAIDRIRSQPFLQGDNNRGWSITFDWFIKPSNFVKVHDGNYDDSGGKSRDKPKTFADLARELQEEEDYDKGRNTGPFAADPGWVP